MGFRFRLAAVLRQKQRIVDEIAGRYARAARFVQQERDTLTTLEDARTGHWQYYADCLGDRDLDATMLRRAAQYAQFLEQALEEQQHRIREMEDRAEKIRELLVEAERARQVFTNLKDRQRTAFYRDLAAREGAYFDGIANTIFTAKHQAATREREH